MQMQRNNCSPYFPWTLLRFWMMRLLPGWCFMAAMIFAVQIAVCGIVHDNENVKAMLNFLKILPGFFRNIVGQHLSAESTDALIAIGYQHPLVLILYMVFAVGTPTGILVGESQRGTMELILSRPVTRTQVYVCAVLPTLLGMFALTQVMFLGTVAGTRIFEFERDIHLVPFYKTALNGGLVAAAVGGISTFIATLNKDRGRAVGIAVAYLVLDYFVRLIGTWWPMMHRLERWTLFHYVGSREIFLEGAYPVQKMLVLGLITLGTVLAGWIIWRRRDLPA